jgi:hypothetical protein
MDSVRITRIELKNYNPNDIAAVSVYKDSSAFRLIGQQGAYGVVYIQTKKFARNKYWNFLSHRSADYLKLVPNPYSDSSVVYILNDKVLKTNFEGTLSSIDDKNFLELRIIGADRLKKDYDITNRQNGIMIRTSVNPQPKK